MKKSHVCFRSEMFRQFLLPPREKRTAERRTKKSRKCFLFDGISTWVDTSYATRYTKWKAVCEFFMNWEERNQKLLMWLMCNPFLFSFLLDELIRNLRHKSEFNSLFRNVPSLVAKICLFYDVCGWLRRNFLCSPHFASRSKTDKGYHLYVNRTRMDRSKERKCSTQMESSKLGVMMTEDCKCWNVLQGETSPTTHDELMSESPSFPHSAAFPVSFRWRSIIHLWFFISPFSRDLRRYFHFARLGEWWIFVKIRLFFFCAREDILINQKMEQIDDANCCHLSERKKEKRMKKRGTGRVLFFIGARVEKPLKIYIYSA